ncbi:MAG: hypothetical protein QOH26_2226, partial [Actinomycetota bacterium]|nr:hypothetical protein [Actinomycetota bacterium]
MALGRASPKSGFEVSLYFGNRRIDELLGELDRNDRAINSRQLTRLRLLAHLDREDVWDDNGYRDMSHWVSAHYRMGYYKADRVLGAARAIDRLPLTAHAFEDGRISEDQLIELSRFATPATEEELLGWVQKVSLGSLKHKADLACRPEPEETERIDKERTLSWWWEDGGSRFGLAAYLPAEEGAKVAAALDELADKIPTLPTDVEDGFGDLTRAHTLDARRADALVMLASEASGDGTSLPTVVLHAELDALLGDGGCEIEGGG